MADLADARSRALRAFVDQALRTPFAWGADDCCLWPANWLVTLGRPDPAADLRGRYTTERGCRRVLVREGGVLAVFGRCAERAGLARAASPQFGDVGVVEADTANGVRAAGAICLGRRWATRAESGLVVAERVPLAAWRV